MKRSVDTDSDYVSGSDYSPSHSTNVTSHNKSLKRMRIEHEIFDKSIKDIEEMFLFSVAKPVPRTKYAYDCVNEDFLPAQAPKVPVLPSQKPTPVMTHCARAVQKPENNFRAPQSMRKSIYEPSLLLDEDVELLSTWNNRRACLAQDLETIEKMIMMK